MAGFINERIFGSNIVGPTRATLEARQQLSSSINLFGESVDTSGNQQTQTSYNIDYNSPYGFTPGSQIDYSQRKPFVRMWTAIRRYALSPNGKRIYPDKSTGNVRIYELGNNNADDYNLSGTSFDEMQQQSPSFNDKGLPTGYLTSNEFSKPNAGITSVQSTTQGVGGIYTDTVVNFKVWNYFDYANIFSKFFLFPGARVFIDFGWGDSNELYNPLDYIDNPKTQGDLDFTTLKKAIWGMKSRDDLTPDNTDGIVAKAMGNIEVMEGYVTDFSAKTSTDGSFDCSITVTSGNKSLIDLELTGEDNSVPADMEKNLTIILMERFFSLMGLSTASGISHFHPSDLLLESFDDPNNREKISKIYLSLMRTVMTNKKTKLTADITTKETVLEPVTYYNDETEREEIQYEWVCSNPAFNPTDPYLDEEDQPCIQNGYDMKRQPVMKEKEIEKKLKHSFNKINQTALRTGIYFQYSDDFSFVEDIDLSNINQHVYISWDFFETEILNKIVANRFTEGETLQWVTSRDDINWTYNETLQKLHRWVKYYEGLPFIYPDTVRTRYVNSDCLVDKEGVCDGQKDGKPKSTYFDWYKLAFKDNRWSQYAMNLSEAGYNTIPAGMVFISYNMILEAMTNSETVYEAVKNICDTISSASYGNMKLRIVKHGDNHMKVIDVNKPAFKLEDGWDYIFKEEENNTDVVIDVGDYSKIDNIFEFSVYSPNSLVKSMDLIMEMPSNTMSSILSINATSADRQIFPNNAETLMSLSLKDLYGKMNDYYEWLPTLDSEYNFRKALGKNNVTSPDSGSISIDFGGIKAWQNKGYNYNPTSRIQILGGTHKDSKGTFNGIPSSVGSNQGPSVEAIVNDIVKQVNAQKTTIQFDSREGLEEFRKQTEKEQEKQEFNKLMEKFNKFVAENPNVLVASSFIEYYQHKLTKEIIQKIEDDKHSLVMPYSINITLYGVGGIIPGNVFRVDWLPEVYRDKVVFITENVSHEFSAGTWNTSISAYMMYRGDKLFNKEIKPLKPEVLWNPQVPYSMGYSVKQCLDLIESKDMEWWLDDPASLEKKLKDTYGDLNNYDYIFSKSCISHHQPNTYNYNNVVDILSQADVWKSLDQDADITIYNQLSPELQSQLTNNNPQISSEDLNLISNWISDGQLLYGCNDPNAVNYNEMANGKCAPNGDNACCEYEGDQ